MTKPVLAIDIDEVLGQFVPSIVKYHNRVYGTELEATSFHSYRFCEVWGGTDEEAMEKVREFYGSEEFKNLPLVEGAVEAMKTLKKDYELHVVTSRQFFIQEATYEWLKLHFDGIFDGIHFGNHYSKTGKKLPKSEICKSIGAICLVDDSLSYTLEVSGSLSCAILFGEYGWNAHDSLPENAYHALNWDEAIKHIYSNIPVDNSLEREA
eukprot:TRINITY_DN777849_c0_g1_i1.p1 TRINITY_DN777849_c0_g1~~TRINITY_DN777849_c0_g1_i1.p1  ORF type:complete len:209 (-),score=56.14 TRINITY_DN777849_c0_g1_i1:251-877(-)